jgi:4-carboxymuconolactone decarboxylase
VATLITARAFDSQFEWAAHERVARKAGVSETTIEAIKHRRPTDGLPEEDAAIIELGRETFGRHQVSAETYARALKLFGPHDLCDIVCLMGQYAATAALLCAFGMQLPEGQEPLLPV